MEKDSGFLCKMILEAVFLMFKMYTLQIVGREYKHMSVGSQRNAAHAIITCKQRVRTNHGNFGI